MSESGHDEWLATDLLSETVSKSVREALKPCSPKRIAALTSESRLRFWLDGNTAARHLSEIGAQSLLALNVLIDKNVSLSNRLVRFDTCIDYILHIDA